MKGIFSISLILLIIYYINFIEKKFTSKKLLAYRQVRQALATPLLVREKINSLQVH